MATSKQDQCWDCVGDNNHTFDVATNLNCLRHENKFCDVILIVGKERYPAHKAVLSSASNYFEVMFSSGFQESTAGEVTIGMTDPGAAESFMFLLEFVYTGSLCVSLSTVVGVLKMACYMLMTNAVKSCEGYLRKIKHKLSIEDCYEIWSLARSHDDLSDIAQMFESHLCKNFFECVQSSLFLDNCSASALAELLRCEDIERDTVTEEQIVEGTLVWLKHDWEERKIHADDLLWELRLGLLPIDRIHQILGDELLSIPECKEKVDDVVELSVTKDTAIPPLNESYPEYYATRNTVAGKFYNDHQVGQDNPFEECDQPGTIFPPKCSTEPVCLKLTKVPDPNPYPNPQRIGNGIRVIVSKAGHLYAAGGNRRATYRGEAEREYEKWLSKNNFFRYDLETNEWIVLPSMPQFMVKPLVFQVDDYICAVNSSDYTSEGVRIERYCIATKTWVTGVDDQSYCVSDAALVNGHIVVIGQEMNEPDEPVAVYNPDKNSWRYASVDGIMDPVSYFMESENECYLVKGERGKTPLQINKCICDFHDVDRPTISIGEIVESDGVEIQDQQSLEFTFDINRLGAEEAICQCPAHNSEGIHMFSPYRPVPNDTEIYSFE